MSKVIVRNKEYEIPEEFLDNEYDEYTCKVKDLSIVVYGSYGQDIINIDEGVCYRFIDIGDEDSYNSYHYRVKKDYNPEDTHTIDKFKNLINDIQENGYNDKYPIIISKVDDLLIVRDGQHRVSVLFEQNPDMEIKVLEMLQ